MNATDEGDGNDRLYNEEELRQSFDSIDAVNFLEEVTVPSTANSSTTIRFTSYHAGHVLGAAMFLIEIAGARILYTGDYSTEEDRHLIPATEPNWGRPPDVMICESTFGVQNHQPREEKEELFVSTVANILKRGGKVLMPVFAVGRSQELLLILEEYWKSRPDLQGFPIYFVGGLASRCMSVYRQYSNSLNANIQSRVARGDNPFDFKKSGFIREIRGLGKKDRFDDSKPCVVMASPGMLQSGPSRELLEKWAPDPKNGLMLCGYSVEGTLARDMQNEPRDFEALISKKRIVRRMTVHYISFAAHVDFAGNSQFIDYCKPTHLILCHGSRDNMFRLRDALKNKYKEKQQDVQIYTPSNVRDRIKIQLTTTRIAKVKSLACCGTILVLTLLSFHQAIGSLAEKRPAQGSSFSGLLLAKDGSYTLLAPSDLQAFAGLATTSILQRQRINIDVGWDLIKWHLEGMYGSVEIGKDPEGNVTMRVMKCVDLKLGGGDGREITMEWTGGSTNDMIADSVLALLMGIDTSPASVKSKHTFPGYIGCSKAHPFHFTETSVHGHHHHADQEENYVLTSSIHPDTPSHIDRLIAFLHSHFGTVEFLAPEDVNAEIRKESHAKGEHLQEDEEEKKLDTASSQEGHRKDEEDTKPKVNGDETETVTKLPARSEVSGPVLRIRLDDHVADVTLEDMAVHSPHDSLKRRVESVLQVASRTITPLAPIHPKSSWVAKGASKRIAVKPEA